MNRAGELEAKLGHLFSDRGLLTQALTHRSFGQPHNERLEYLGDSVLNCLVAKLLFDRYPALAEGDLSRMRANLVNQATLAEIAAELDVGVLLRLGDGEQKTGGASRASILADAFEALVGAVFLDAGFDRAMHTVAAIFAVRLRDNTDAGPGKDAKTALQEWLQGQRLPLPQYQVLRIEGAAHQQTFHVRCEVPACQVVADGEGLSRRAAEQAAAARALAQVGVKGLA